jgi:ribosomal protein L3 glutamine methyltransferase
MNNHQELVSIKDFIRYAVTRFNAAHLFYGHGTDNAWDEAFALILAALHLPHDLDPGMLDSRITTDERIKILELIDERVKKHRPVPYLMHEAWFCNLVFYVNEKVLIPRSPLGELIVKAFEPWIDSHKVKNILDLCTGSGCIAIACAKMFPDAQVDASDISQEVLDVAKINVEKHQVSNRVHLIKSDLFNSIPKKPYDVIISNPPYVTEQEMQELPAEFRHEPKLALAAGEDGLDFAIPIMKSAAKFLAPHGILIVEVGNSEINMAEKFPRIPFTWLEFENGGGGVFLLTKEQLDMVNF